MPAARGEEYWAQWARDYCEVAAVYPQRPGVVMAELTGSTGNVVATSVKRCRQQGLITPVEDGAHLTPKAMEILNHLDVPAESVVAFNVKILARTKSAALAKLWELELQLENWDPKSGPFRPKEQE